MNVIVLGGLGIMGVASLMYLPKEHEILKVTVVDQNAEAVKRVVAWLNASVDHPKFVGRVVDVTNHDALVEAMNGNSIVINCASIPGKYFATTKAALDVGAHYIDVGSFGEEAAQLTLFDDFKKRDRTAVLGMGFTPGLVNIASAYAIERLTKTLRVDIRWSIVDIVSPSSHSRALYGGFNWWGYIHNYFTLSSTRWEEGTRRDFPPRNEPELFTFKGPVGIQEVAGWPGYDSDFLAALFPDIPYIESKAAVGDETERKWKLLQGLGFNAREPVRIGEQEIAPWAVLEHLLTNQPEETKMLPDIRHGGAVIVSGLEDGRKVQYRIDIWPSKL